MQIFVSSRMRWVALAAALCSFFIAALDQTIVATSLPRIIKDLGEPQLMTWVVSAYLLAEIVAIPIVGKLSDLYGRKLFVAAALFVFLVGSALVGQAHSIYELIIFRGLQGLGAGGLLSIAATVVGDIFPPAQRPRWQGLLAGSFALATIAGPLGGGWITDHWSWRWNFFINIPIGLVVMAMFLISLRNVRTRASIELDFAGAFLLSGSLVTAVLALLWGGTEYPWNSLVIIGLLAAAAIGFAVFLWVEAHSPEPIFRIDFFWNRTLASALTLSFLTSAALFGAVIYIPLFVQQVLGRTATNSGLALLPLIIALFCTSLIVGQLVSPAKRLRRLSFLAGRYKVFLVVGTAITILGMWLMAQISPTIPYSILIRNMAVIGIGLGCIFPILIVVVQNAVTHKDLGAATAANQLARNLGGVVGLAVLGSAFNGHLNEGLAVAIQEVFMIAWLILLIAFIAALVLKETPLRKEN